MPVRMKRIVAPPVRRMAIAWMIAATMRAPAKAKIGRSAVGGSGSTTSIVTTARPAPWLTPTKLGSASALRVTVCRIAPEPANNAPAIAAVSARGRRNSQTTVAAMSEGALPTTLRSASPADMGKLPDISDASVIAAVSARSKARTASA